MSDKRKTPYDTVIVSGGFDPVHIGHIRLIREAAQYGDVIVVANSDEWLYRKKGFNFMGFRHRVEILESIKGVIRVESVNDSDGSVCEAIRRIKPTYFANGGDRNTKNTPEKELCEELGIEMLWGIGGDDKVAASDALVERVRAVVDAREPRSPPVRYISRHSER